MTSVPHVVLRGCDCDAAWMGSFALTVSTRRRTVGILLILMGEKQRFATEETDYPRL